MASKQAAARDTSVPVPACEVCNGTECGTPRIPVCCEACTH
jgi:hypothetical protein